MIVPGLEIISVRPGATIVGDDGRTLIVQKGKAVRQGQQIFMVQSDYEMLAQRLQERGL